MNICDDTFIKAQTKKEVIHKDNLFSNENSNNYLLTILKIAARCSSRLGSEMF